MISPLPSWGAGFFRWPVFCLLSFRRLLQHDPQAHGPAPESGQVAPRPPGDRGVEAVSVDRVHECGPRPGSGCSSRNRRSQGWETWWKTTSLARGWVQVQGGPLEALDEEAADEQLAAVVQGDGVGHIGGPVFQDREME